MSCRHQWAGAIIKGRVNHILVDQCEKCGKLRLQDAVPPAQGIDMGQVSIKSVRQFIADRTPNDEHREDVLSGDYDHTAWFDHIRELMTALAAFRGRGGLGQFRDLLGFAVLQAINLPETDPRRDFIRQANELLALIDQRDAAPGVGS